MLQPPQTPFLYPTWSCPTCTSSSLPNPPPSPSTPFSPSTHSPPPSPDSSLPATPNHSRSPSPSHAPSPYLSPPPPPPTPLPTPPPSSPCILQFNCNGLLSSHSELSFFLHKHSIPIACLQETKLSSKSNPKPFPGYTLIRKDRVGRPGGGVAFLAHFMHYTSLSHLSPKFAVGWSFYFCN